MIIEKIKNAWSLFRSARDPTKEYKYDPSDTYSINGSFQYINIGGRPQTLQSIANRIAVDCALASIQHVSLDENGRYKDTVNDNLNQLLTVSSNIDQTGRELIQDAVYTMFVDKVSVIVPTLTKKDLYEIDSSDEIYEARVGKVVQWKTRSIDVEIYNDFTGTIETINVPKEFCCILQNPFYQVVNGAKSIGKRLQALTNKIDSLNNRIDSKRLDLIIQFPFATRNETHKRMAKERKEMIEQQLIDSPYGLGFVDANEHIIQLNRGIENNLWQQYTELLSEFYNELGLSEGVFKSTATEVEIVQYTNRILEPLLNTVVEEMERKWLSIDQRKNNEAIRYYKDPFKLMPASQIAETSDKLTRNEIATSNEIRGFLGMKPSDDPKADMLVNANINQSNSRIEEIDNSAKIQNQIKKDGD